MKTAFRIEWYGLCNPKNLLYGAVYCNSVWNVHELLNVGKGGYRLCYKGQYYLRYDRLFHTNKFLVDRAVKKKRYEKKFPITRKARI